MTESELPKASLGDNERRRVKQLAALPVALRARRVCWSDFDEFANRLTASGLDLS